MLEHAASTLRVDTGGSVPSIPTDIGDPRSVSMLFEAIADRLARLDLLVNNAGVLVPGAPLEEVRFEAAMGVKLVDRGVDRGHYCQPPAAANDSL